MSLVNFYKGPESEYLEETHGGGIYQCTDSENTYIFGVKNKSSETEIINLAFNSLPDNGSQHTIDQSNFNKLASALDNNKVIYVRTACNLFVVHSIYDSSLYNTGNRSIVHLYFHFNMGNIASGSVSTRWGEIIRDVNGYITIDMTQTPDESNNYTYTIYTRSPYYVLDKITTSIDKSLIEDCILVDYSGDNYNYMSLNTTYTIEELKSILDDVNNNDTKLVIEADIFNKNNNNKEYLVFRKCSDNLYDSAARNTISTTLECNINFPYNRITNISHMSSSINKQNGFFITYNIPTIYLTITTTTNNNNSDIRFYLGSKPDLPEGILYIGPDLITKSETEDNVYYISNLNDDNTSLISTNIENTSSFFNLVRITKSIFSNLSVIFKLPDGKIIKTRPTTSYEEEVIADGATIDYYITVSSIFTYNKSRENNPELDSFIISFGQYMITFIFSYSTSYDSMISYSGSKYIGKIVLS